MSKKITAQGPKRPSVPALISLWFVATISLLLLVPTGAAIMADSGSFRSCSVNGSGLFIENCGKRTLNGGDVLIGILFLGSLTVVVCLFTHAFRLTRRSA
jgi:hypothetical protein